MVCHVFFLILYILYKIEIGNSEIYLAEVSVSSTMGDRQVNIAATGLLSRVSDPMLNPIPKSIHFLKYRKFGALFDIFPLVNVLELVQHCKLALVICLLIYN